MYNSYFNVAVISQTSPYFIFESIPFYSASWCLAFLVTYMNLCIIIKYKFKGIATKMQPCFKNLILIVFQKFIPAGNDSDRGLKTEICMIIHS